MTWLDVERPLSPEDAAEFERWVAVRPPEIQEMVRRTPPGRLYRNTQTGQVMEVQAYGEDGTIRAYVLPECSPVTGGFSVFGIDPNHLEVATQEYVSQRVLETAKTRWVFREKESEENG